MREMWINGASRAGASGQTIPVQDPATEEVIDSVPAGNADDVRAAVDAASSAFREWRQAV
jgi:aldehyde dehydrogenase (NAD+)